MLIWENTVYYTKFFKNFTKFTRLKPANLLKKRLYHRCFPVNFVEFLRTSFCQKTSKWLLLVAGGDFFPVIFPLIKLICNISTCKTYLSAVSNISILQLILTGKTDFYKQRIVLWQEACAFVDITSFENFPHKTFVMMMSHAHFPDYII